MAEVVPALRLDALTKQFAERTAVDQLSLELRPGELFGFLGPNGAGKTTTIKMIVGLLRPTSGTAQVCGYDVVEDGLKTRSLVGYVPDQPSLYEKLTGREMLEFAADIFAVPRQVQESRIDPLLDAFDLKQRSHELVQTYSRGMRQKLALSAALLHDPKVIFLDEPTVGLDPAGAKQLKEVLRYLSSEGKTVFLSTHVLEVAEFLCDRVGIFQRGKLIAEGSPQELRSSSGQKSLESAFLRITNGDEDDLTPLLRALK